MLREFSAGLTALRRDIGKAARRQNSGAGEKSDGMAAVDVDQGSTRKK
jgi:hypothetical protein